MHPEKRRGVEACVHRVLASRAMCAPEERGAVRVAPRTYATQFKKKLILKQSFSHVGFQRKRKRSSGNRILWTSGQVTEVHKILVTTCVYFAYALSVWSHDGAICAQLKPTEFCQFFFCLAVFLLMVVLMVKHNFTSKII